VRIEAVTEATPELHAALARLLPQLNPRLTVPDMDRLRRLVADPAVTLLVARDGDEIVGTTTVIVYTTPFWIKARLDEVVVDGGARGKGVGEALVQASQARGGAVEMFVEAGADHFAANKGFISPDGAVFQATERMMHLGS